MLLVNLVCLKVSSADLHQDTELLAEFVTDPRVEHLNDDQYLRTYALRHHYATATQLQARLRDVRGTRVSRQTIRNRLHHFSLNARRPLQVTPLTPRHRHERLQWAQRHVTWTMQQWSTVLYHRIHHHLPIPPAHPQLSVHG
uniref:Transposase Tc1-like domain-containing protein n=1 Tax=Echeneis naucrates TaxID=173247 RepID=A0A665VFF3_ECHNA